MKLAVAMMCCWSWSSIVHADTDPEAYVTVAPSKGAQAPQIVATVIHAPKAPADKISLSPVDAPAVSLHAASVRRYADGTEPISIVLVVEGLEVWMGNDDIEKDAALKYPGVLKPLAKALDAWKPQVPKGSTAGIVTYADTAKIRVPLRELHALSGKSLGSQKDYYHTMGSELVAGVTTGLHMLEGSSAPRKLLVVIGDGNDTNASSAKTALAELKKVAAKSGVVVSALVYKSPISDAATAITNLTSHVDTLASTDDIARALARLASTIDDRYYVTFPGYDAKTKQGLAWDGKPHDLVITIDGKRLPPVTMAAAPAWTPPASK